MGSTLKMSDWENQDFFKNYDHLGTDYPYYANGDHSFFSFEINNIIERLPHEKRVIDRVGIVEILNKGHLLGNRTLVEGVKRSPWMGKPNTGEGWDYASIPAHGNLNVPAEVTIRDFKAALEKEALVYLKDKKRVGILLSGGLDSRIVAGIVRQLQLRGDFAGDAIAITWGVDNCRDIIYSQEIAKRYKWEWVHFDLNPDVLKENIVEAGLMGAEFSPFHLHAMPRISMREDLDAILVGNYGDGVGRAEFSGVNVLKLRRTIPTNLNRYYLLNRSLIGEVIKDIHKDAWEYRNYVTREKEFQYREIEYFMHCIRRRSQGCINSIRRKIPVYQFFTDPATFSVIWNLDPGLRNGEIYKGLLKSLPGDIYNIPWARNGKIFGEDGGQPDKFYKQHHKYGIWIRTDLAPYVKDLVSSEEIRSLSFLNWNTLSRVLANWDKNSNTVTINKVDEIIAWLASLAVFLKAYRLKTSTDNDSKILDKICSHYGAAKFVAYQKIREKIR